MGSIQLWHLTVVVIVLLAAAAIAGLVYFIRKNSPAQPQTRGKQTPDPPAAGS